MLLLMTNVPPQNGCKGSSAGAGARVLLLMATVAGVQAAWLAPVEHAGYQDETARQMAAEQLARASRAAKAAAEAFARQHSLPMRIEAGGAVRELMRINEDGQPEYYITYNVNAAISTAADLVRNTPPYNANGSNLTVGVWDAGAVLSNHQEFGGRVTVKDGATPNYHTTHVGGTIGAAGVVSSARGMAPSVMIDSYEWNSDTSEMSSRAASAPNQPGRIYLSNHSYGANSGWDGIYWNHNITVTQSPSFGQYNSAARTWDIIAYNAPYYLIVKAAGNDRGDHAPASGATFYYWNGTSWSAATYNPAVHPKGDNEYKNGYDTIATFGVAKNILTVGAVNDAVSGSVRAPANGTMSTFSSWGPADDGRIKPDIVGNGVSLYSTYTPHTNSYATSSGTSMATPNVCGSAALLIDYFGKLHPGSAMRASTLKALIIHTADDLGNPGPDYRFGWGLMNTLRAAQVIDEDATGMSAQIIEAALNALTKTNTYVVAYDGSVPLRATLCWTDPAGTATTANDYRVPRLVNDLDLRVYGPSGETNLPFIMDYAAPDAPAANGDNIVDNVEQVLLPTGSPAGMYHVTVSHKGSSLTGVTQYYSLIISGMIIPEPGTWLAAALGWAWWWRTWRERNNASDSETPERDVRAAAAGAGACRGTAAQCGV